MISGSKDLKTFKDMYGIKSMKCTKCGKELTAGAKFCVNCGAKVGNTPKRRCRKCGSEVGVGFNYCVNCGAKVDIPVNKSGSGNNPKNNAYNRAQSNSKNQTPGRAASSSAGSNATHQNKSSFNPQNIIDSINDRAKKSTSKTFHSDILKGRLKKSPIKTVGAGVLAFLIIAVLFSSISGKDSAEKTKAQDPPTPTASSVEKTIRIMIPDIKSQTPSVAKETLMDAGFTNIAFDGVSESDIDKEDGKWVVTDQNPSAGQEIEPGDKIVLSCSKQISVPEVTGKSLKEAIVILGKAGITNVKGEPYSDISKEAEWIVDTQSIVYGETVGENEEIVLHCKKVDELNEAKEENSKEENRTSVERIKTESSSEASALNSFEGTDVSKDENESNSESSFWIKYIDVGQGDAALIQCDDHYLMIDGGPTSASSVIYTILKESGIEYIDYMIATHPDEDHIGGLPGALNYASVGNCYSPVTSHDTRAFNSLVKYLNKQGVSLTVPSDGTELTLGKAKVELMGEKSAYADSNDLSIVTKITYGSNTFLFTGDADIEEENALINAKKDLSCDVLKVGHHGSKGSTGDDFLKKAKPKYAVISVGTDNSYGHPTAETLSRLSNAKVELYRTDLQGDILCNSDGENITFTTEKKASTDVLWMEGSVSTATTTQDGVVVASPEKAVIPSGTTYVINASSKRFHLTTCSSVNEMKASNRRYTTDSAEALVAEGYIPCKRCKPYTENINYSENTTETDDSNSLKDGTDTQEADPSESAVDYVLNTKSKKFHYPYCSSVSDMSSKNRKDVTLTREEIISQGYVPCKRCNP